MRWLVLLVSGSLAGCLQNNLTPCGDQFCPAGKQCHEATQGCFGPDQIRACDGKLDLDDCMFGPFSGFCLDGICLAPRCGDGFIQPEIGEACDDGIANSMDPDAACRPSCKQANCGDGVVDPIREEICDLGEMNGMPDASCAIDCGSDQTCGNGIQDIGEECDDANDLVRDGCSGCKAEQFVVQQLAGASPRARINAAMAYDAARERVVIFGGRSPSGGFRKDTLEWDGARWRDRRPLVAPSGREAAVAVYDSTRHRVVLFGGDDGDLKDDLWEFDGAIWTSLATPVAPPARRGHAMVYDPIRKQLVLFGGTGAAGTLGDTWTWNGILWTDVTPPVDGPPPTENVAMAFDAKQGRVVMFGGRTAQGLTNATWFWDGTTWTQATVTGTVPTAREDVMLAFDAARGRIVAVGAKSGNFTLSDVFELDNTTWSTAGFFSFANEGPSIAYDAKRRQLVAFMTQFNSTFTFVRNAASPSWLTVGLLTPPPRVHAAAAYDARLGRLVMFGGQDEQFNIAPVETWEWDGSRWTVSLAAGPSERVRPVMEFSGRERRVVMTGGRADGTDTDLWSWSGTSWTQLNPPNPLLGVRYTAGLAYDAKRDRLLLHGGHFQGNLEATFEWDTTWSQLAPALSAGDRHNFAMAYDPVRERTVMVGGNDSFRIPAPAVEFDGSSWVSIAEEPGNQFGRGSRLVFDSNARKMVYLFDPEDTGVQVWDYDGRWRQREPSPPLPPLYRPVTVFDAVRSEIVMFGGRVGGSGSPVSNATTILSFQPNEVVESCTSSVIDYDGDGFAGCMDPDCAPRCTPTCLPGTQCAITSSTCGDGACDPLEDCRLCPGDCGGTCTASDCGDFDCAGTETAANCPSDCGQS